LPNSPLSLPSGNSLHLQIHMLLSQPLLHAFALHILKISVGSLSQSEHKFHSDSLLKYYDQFLWWPIQTLLQLRYNTFLL
jgi:hypothetical protein